VQPLHTQDLLGPRVGGAQRGGRAIKLLCH
jgi:hypothetical protein